MSQPLSATRPDRMRGFTDFVDECSWLLHRPSDHAPDTWLLMLLDERVRWLEGERMGLGAAISWPDPDRAPELPTVGELPDDWLMPVIEDVVARFPARQLAGADDEAIAERVDAHFDRLQEARRREVADREAQLAEDTRRREATRQAFDDDVAERAGALWGTN